MKRDKINIGAQIGDWESRIIDDIQTAKRETLFLPSTRDWPHHASSNFKESYYTMRMTMLPSQLHKSTDLFFHENIDL
jgi:hypothetical protein